MAYVSDLIIATIYINVYTHMSEQNPLLYEAKMPQGDISFFANII